MRKLRNALMDFAEEFTDFLPDILMTALCLIGYGLFLAVTVGAVMFGLCIGAKLAGLT